MTKALAIALTVLAIVVIAAFGLLWHWGSRQRRKALHEAAKNPLQDIREKHDKIVLKLAEESDEEAWRREQENIASRRRSQ